MEIPVAWPMKQKIRLLSASDFNGNVRGMRRTTRGFPRSLRCSRHTLVLRSFDCHLASGKRIYSTRRFCIPSTPIVDDTLPSHDSKILPRTFRSPRSRRLNHPINTPRSVQFHRRWITLLTGDNRFFEEPIENNQMRMIVLTYLVRSWE